jgi:hypothetical protein
MIHLSGYCIIVGKELSLRGVRIRPDTKMEESRTWRQWEGLESRETLRTALSEAAHPTDLWIRRQLAA